MSFHAPATAGQTVSTSVYPFCVLTNIVRSQIDSCLSWVGLSCGRSPAGLSMESEDRGRLNYKGELNMQAVELERLETSQ